MRIFFIYKTFPSDQLGWGKIRRIFSKSTRNRLLPLTLARL